MQQWLQFLRNIFSCEIEIVEWSPPFEPCKTNCTIYDCVNRCGASGSMRACHAAGPDSIPGRDRFPGWGFFGVFPHLSDICQETLGPQGPRISFGRRHHHSIFALLGWLSVCLVCIVCHVCAVSEVAPALGWSLIRRGPPCPCVVKKSMYVIHSLIPSPDRSWLCKARVAWEVKLR